jgi:hypothetical protein
MADSEVTLGSSMQYAYPTQNPEISIPSFRLRAHFQKVASNFAKAFNSLLDTYQQIGKSLPMLA